jgi:hypothetical protein
MIFDHQSRTGRGPLAAGSLTEIVDASPRGAAMSRGPQTRWSTRTAAAPSRPGHTYELETPQASG